MKRKEGVTVKNRGAGEGRGGMKRCRYTITDPNTYDFKSGCNAPRDTDHGFCKQHRDMYEDLHNMTIDDAAPVFMLDGKFGMVIRTPTENHPMVGIQVDGEEDIRWREPSKIVGEPLIEIE